MKYLKFFPLFVLSIIFISSSVLAQDKMMKDKKEDKMMDEKMDNDMMMEHTMMKIDKDKDGVAIKGYDPVAYFTDDAPMMGETEYSYEWNGAEWHFTNEEHMEMFKENPEKYAPQYGGFCAYGVTVGKCFPTDPEAWKIVDGKLYLNKNKEVAKEWRKDIKGNIKKGEKGWMMINSEKEMK